MGQTKTRLPRVWEEILQQHLELFEDSRKEFDLRYDESRKDINARFEENRRQFEDAVLEIRHITERLNGAELSWKEERRLMEERVNADRRATETRLAAERTATEARLEADRKEAAEKLEADRKEAAERLERDRKEFVSQKRWLIANFLGIIGILVAIVIFLMQNQQPTHFFAL